MDERWAHHAAEIVFGAWGEVFDEEIWNDVGVDVLGPAFHDRLLAAFAQFSPVCREKRWTAQPRVLA